MEAPKHERRGSVSKVRIDFGVPAEDAATRAELRGITAKQDTEHLEVKAQRKDASMAVHAAFNVARRRLKRIRRPIQALLNLAKREARDLPLRAWAPASLQQVSVMRDAAGIRHCARRL